MSANHLFTSGVAIAVGNSHLRWAVFDRWGLGAVSCRSIKEMDTDWLECLGEVGLVAIASVVPQFTEKLVGKLAEILSGNLSGTVTDFAPRVLTLADIPLGNMYPTLGIDRAIGAWQAVQMYGAPVLMIDGGTAISLTAIAEDSGGSVSGIFMGGAILAGRAMQLASLHHYTAALPNLEFPQTMPPLWGQTTADSIYTGISQGAIGAVERFLEKWQGAVVFTGGDGAFLHQALGKGEYVPNLVLLGMRQLLLPLLS